MSWIDQRPDDAMDGAFTALGPEPVRTVEPTVFREAMSRLRAGVRGTTTARTGRTRPAAHGGHARPDGARGLLGLVRAAHAARLSHPPQPDQPDRGGERRVLR